MALSNTKAIDQIHALLDDREWDESTLFEIAAIVSETGREVRTPEDAEPPVRWLIGWLSDQNFYWSDERGWGERQHATTFSQSQRESRIPDSEGYWITVEEAEAIAQGRRSGAYNQAMMNLRDSLTRSYIVEWRRVPTDERGDRPDAEFEVIWPSTPEENQALTIRYTVDEIVEVTNEINNTPGPRPNLVREYTTRYGERLGQTMARRQQMRPLVIPRSQRIAEWTWHQGDHRPLTSPRYWDDGMVLEATYRDRSVAIRRDGHDDIRHYNPETDEYDTEEGDSARWRELFPNGDIEGEYEVWAESHFIIYEPNPDADPDDLEEHRMLDSAYDMRSALQVAARHLGNVMIPEPTVNES